MSLEVLKLVRPLPERCTLALFDLTVATSAARHMRMLGQGKPKISSRGHSTNEPCGATAGTSLEPDALEPDASCSALHVPPGCDSPAACLADLAHAIGPDVHALEGSEGHVSAFFSTSDTGAVSRVGLAVASDMSAQPTFDTSPTPTLDTSAQHVLDTSPEPILDTSAQHVLDTSPQPTLDMSAQHELDASALPTLDTPAEQTLDASALPSLDTPAQHALDTSALPSLDSSAQHTLDKSALPSLAASAQHALDTPALPSLDSSAPQAPAHMNDRGRSGDYDRPPIAETTPDSPCIGSSPPPAHAPQTFEALAGSPGIPLNTPPEVPLDISINALADGPHGIPLNAPAEDPHAFPRNTLATEPLGMPATTSAEPHGIHVNALAGVALGMPLNAPAEDHLEIPINTVAGDPLDIPANAPAPQLHEACEESVACSDSLSGPPSAGVVREGGVPEDDLSATPSLPRGTREQCTEDNEGPASCASGGSCSTYVDASSAPYLQADHVGGVPGDGIGAHVELPPPAKEDQTFVDVPADAKDDRTTVDLPPLAQNVEDGDLHEKACADAESCRGGLARPPLTQIDQECGAPSDGLGDDAVIHFDSPTATCATCVDLPPPQVPGACEGPETRGASGPDGTVSIEEQDYSVEEEEEYYAQATGSTVEAKSVSMVPVTSTPLQSPVNTCESRAQPDDGRACEPGKDGARACRATRELHGPAKAASVEEQVFPFQKEMEPRSPAVPLSLGEQVFSKDIQEEQEFQAQPFRPPSMAAVHHVTVPDISHPSQSSAARTLSGAPTQTQGSSPMVTALHPARHSLPVVSATIGGGSAMALLPGRYAPPTATSSMGDGFAMALLPGRHAAPNPTALVDGCISAAVHPVRHAHSLAHTLELSNDFRSLGRDMQSHGTTQAGIHQRSCSLSGVRYQSGTHVGPCGSAAESLHLDSVSLGRLARQWPPDGLPSGAGDGLVTMATRTAPGPATRWDPHSAAISDPTDVSAHQKYPKAIATRSSRLSRGASCGANALDTWGPTDVTHVANGSCRMSQGPPCGTKALGTCGPCDAMQMGTGSGRMSRASSCGTNCVGTCGPCEVTQLGSGSSRMSRASLGGSKGVGACGPCDVTQISPLMAIGGSMAAHAAPCGSKGASIYGQSEVVQKGCASPPPAGNELRGTIKVRAYSII